MGPHQENRRADESLTRITNSDGGEVKLTTIPDLPPGTTVPLRPMDDQRPDLTEIQKQGRRPRGQGSNPENIYTFYGQPVTLPKAETE